MVSPFNPVSFCPLTANVFSMEKTPGSEPYRINVRVSLPYAAAIVSLSGSIPSGLITTVKAVLARNPAILSQLTFSPFFSFRAYSNRFTRMLGRWELVFFQQLQRLYWASSACQHWRRTWRQPGKRNIPEGSQEFPRAQNNPTRNLQQSAANQFSLARLGRLRSKISFLSHDGL